MLSGFKNKRAGIWESDICIQIAVFLSVSEQSLLQIQSLKVIHDLFDPLLGLYESCYLHTFK